MPTLHSIAVRLFTRPGGPPAEEEVLCLAARAHRHLFQRECQENAALGAALPWLRLCLRRRGNPHLRDRLFCHPALVEGLHRLALSCPGLKTWHAAVASPSVLDVASSAPLGAGCLGTVEFVLRMRHGCVWDGPLRLTSDLLGRLPLPFCDWTIRLHSAEAGPDCVLADADIDVTTDRHGICLQWVADEAPFLIMPRDMCRQMLVDNPLHLQTGGCCCASRRISPMLVRAIPLCENGVRYEQIHIADPRNAEETEAIVGCLHEALHHNSPAMHHEFCTLMSAIRGYELQLTTSGTVQSFADPTQPGIMSLNIPYNERHEPHLSPLCFTWLAHELAHTKFYLINDIAYDHGWTFLRNGAEMTNPIARYGRRLPVRTLFQIPYTHIYEWESLMDFIDRDFTGLPWPINENPIDYGEDLRSEIEEAFTLCDEVADLTPLGAEAFGRFTELYEQSLARWKRRAAA